jgi:hypothetical protein
MKLQAKESMHVVSKAKSMFWTLLNFLGALMTCKPSGVKKPIPEVMGANACGRSSMMGAVAPLAFVNISARWAKRSSTGKKEPMKDE